MFSDPGNNTVLMTPYANATCQDFLGGDTTPPLVIKYMCDLTVNGTDNLAILFNALCCTLPIEPPPVDSEKAITDFFAKVCHSTNLTNELRKEFCAPFIPFVPEAFTISIATYILLSLLTPLGVLANLLIVFTVLKCKKLKNTTGYFISNLAVADLLCIVGMVAYLITCTQIDIRGNITALLIFSSVDVSIGSASLLHVTAASVERAIAVAKPMVYPLILRKERAKKVIGWIWVYCLILFTACCARVFIKTKIYSTVIFYFAVSCSFFIPCVIVLISYINISVKALKNLQMEKRIQRSMIAVSMLNEFGNSQSKKSRLHPQVRELKLALNLTVMTVPFVFGWGYFMIGNIYEEVSHTTLTGYQNWFINMLPYLISCLNPITYLLFTQTLRKESMKLLSKPFRKFKNLHHRRFSSNSTLLSTTSRGPRNSDCSETRMI